MILQLLLQIASLYLLLIVPLATAAANSPLALPNCTDVCGNVTIPYPFGIEKGCYLDEWFAITCDDSFYPKKPFLTKVELEVLAVSLLQQSVRLNIHINFANSNCAVEHLTVSSTKFTGSPFKFSSRYNQFIVVGCDDAFLTYDGASMVGCNLGCRNFYTTSNISGGGIDCCNRQTSIPIDLDSYNVTIGAITKVSHCTYAFLVESGWYPGNLSNPCFISKIKKVPVLIQWELKQLVYVKKGDFHNYTCRFPSESYECYCKFYYNGNPYIPNGCKVIEECANCERECDISPGKGFYCHRSNKTEIILGASLGGGLLMIFFCGICFWLYKLLKKQRTMKLKKKFYKRNGGLLLQQQISSNEGIVDKTLVFNSKELEKATDNFNENRILGQGGQGTVYKGMLTDGKIIAIKKSKIVDESQIGQFINEVVLLSQINHRNIVKLLGCCLETEVPLLVYEFISNGNLFELIHDQNEEFQLSWKMRLQIATEVAGALAYLHSASSVPIYHRDIKSTNILLDDKFRAKVSDFGTSRSIAIGQTHLTTLVHGTFGYLDPEYFQSSQFTEKSDVYSFGVVLVELLTGQKPISSKSDEEKSLATRFILFLKETRLFDLLDACVIEEAGKEEVTVIADIARRCLSLSGKKRPTMIEVAMELEGIRMSHMPQTVSQTHDNECVFEMKGPINDASSSAISGAVYQRGFSSDVDPLLLSTI